MSPEVLIVTQYSALEQRSTSVQEIFYHEEKSRFDLIDWVDKMVQN